MLYNMQRQLANMCTCYNCVFIKCNRDHLIYKTISTKAQTIFILIILYAMTYQALSFSYQKIHTVLACRAWIIILILYKCFPQKKILILYANCFICIVTKYAIVCRKAVKLIIVI